MNKNKKLIGAVLLVVLGLVVGSAVPGFIDALIARALPRAHASTIISGTTETLEVITSAAGSIDYTVSYVDYTSSAATPGDAAGNITTATTTTFVSAPGASTQRQLKRSNFHNSSTTTSNTLTIQKDVSGTNYIMYLVTLAPGETITVDAEGARYVYDSDGIVKAAGDTVIDGRTVSFLKVGATSEAAGLFQWQAKDTGMPGAWVPGTPGVNGDAISCNTTADATIGGAPYLPDPSVGNYYLTAFSGSSSVAGMPAMWDLIWYNTGLVVTTTTAQTVTLPTLPSRDQNGSTQGDGWQAGVLVTTATTNASAITNMTLSYTNSDGTAGRTATMSSFPATAVAGAMVPFLLQAGDRGIQNIASITLGTSLVTGAVSLILFRPLVFVPSPVANVGGTMSVVNAAPGGVKLWNGTCLEVGYLASATTATTLALTANLTVK